MSIGRRQLLRGALSTVAMAGYSKISAAQSPKRVSFLLDVLTNPKHALFYPAAKQGLFAGQGLDVTLETGKGSADVIQNIARAPLNLGLLMQARPCLDEHAACQSLSSRWSITIRS